MLNLQIVIAPKQGLEDKDDLFQVLGFIIKELKPGEGWANSCEHHLLTPIL